MLLTAILCFDTYTRVQGRFHVEKYPMIYDDNALNNAEKFIIVVNMRVRELRNIL